ncbi:MAG TPA: hypothetical protein VN253_04520 [Kofleriaceae bacterium]|nr:hypothetical protein [Kofleriaceae bacterium]
MRSSIAISLPLLACVACGVHLGDGADGLRTDASVTGDDDAAQPDSAPSPDVPACANGRVVYLSFDGVALTRATPSDATQNRASWMNIAQGTAPRYKTGAANRDQLIQDVTTGIRTQLSSFPVTVVTQRPAAGPYVMIVFGGAANQVGSNFGGAVQQLDCGDAAKSDVAWISDNVGPTQRVVNFAVGAIGFGLGLTGTSDPLDCMCGWANACTSDNSVACKLSPMITRDPNANQRCPGLTTQNEVAAFDAAFCR